MLSNNKMATNFMQIGFLLLLLLIESSHARIGYFWHITDLHLDTIYSTQGDVTRSCWRIERQTSSSPASSPGRFGDYLCDSPWSLIESAAKAMKSRQGDNVEFVLWTGDGLSHSAHPMFESKKMEILRNITDLLGRTFPSQFVFPVLGHEDGTTTNFRHMGELWRHWLPSEALHTFEKGGYYSIEQTKSRLRIIALNTNFMRHDPKYSQSHLAPLRQRTPSSNSPDAPQEYRNYYYHHGTLHQHQHGHGSDWSSFGYGYNGHGHRGIPGVAATSDNAGNGARVSALSEYENQDTEKQWIWLEDVLSKSKSNKETVYIVGHIPPGSDERYIGLQQNGHTTFTESNNKRYLDLVRKYSSIIQGQFFGHLHSDSFRIIYDDKGKPVSWIMISPSVTPRKMSVGSNNPAMRLYKFDTDSGQVLDYTQYYMDLQLANSLGEPNWVPEYNLTHYYALSDISAISLHNFVDRFTSSDGSWFAKYYRANAVRYATDPCEGVCMLYHYCAITRVDYKEFRQCLEKEKSALHSHASAIRNSACPCFLLFVIVLIVTYFHGFVTLLYSSMAYVCAAIATGTATATSSVTTSSKNHFTKHQLPAKLNRILSSMTLTMTLTMMTKLMMRIFKSEQPTSSSSSSSLLVLQHRDKISQIVATLLSKDLCLVQQRRQRRQQQQQQQRQPITHKNYSHDPNEFLTMTSGGIECATPSTSPPSRPSLPPKQIISSQSTLPAVILPMSRPGRWVATDIVVIIRYNINADDAFVADGDVAVAQLLNNAVAFAVADGDAFAVPVPVAVAILIADDVDGLNFYRPFLLAILYNAADAHAAPTTFAAHIHQFYYCAPIFTLHSISFLAKLAFMQLLLCYRLAFLQDSTHHTINNVEQCTAFTWYQYVF